jgi:tRNA pseudouridine55 synthase
VRKSGHAGTLDPTADGVLVLCMGRATKLVEALMDQPKVYRATARLDVTSTSFDTEQALTPVPVDAPPSRDEVTSAGRRFEGEIEQVPPAFSALKVSGRPAYKFAARGQAVELRPRTVRVDWVHVHAYDWPTLDFEMCCGRGTYVRALIRDWGKALGCGGCLTSLTRNAIGRLTLGRSGSTRSNKTRRKRGCWRPTRRARGWKSVRLKSRRVRDLILLGSARFQ